MGRIFPDSHLHTGTTQQHESQAHTGSLCSYKAAFSERYKITILSSGIGRIFYAARLQSVHQTFTNDGLHAGRDISVHGRASGQHLLAVLGRANGN